MPLQFCRAGVRFCRVLKPLTVFGGCCSQVYLVVQLADVSQPPKFASDGLFDPDLPSPRRETEAGIFGHLQAMFPRCEIAAVGRIIAVAVREPGTAKLYYSSNAGWSCSLVRGLDRSQALLVLRTSADGTITPLGAGAWWMAEPTGDADNLASMQVSVEYPAGTSIDDAALVSEATTELQYALWRSIGVDIQQPDPKALN